MEWKKAGEEKGKDWRTAISTGATPSANKIQSKN